MLTTRTPPSERGFSLVELAVVLIIISLVLTMGLGAINAQLLSANYTATKKRQDLIKDALIAYFGANKRLPCPQIPVAGTPVDGVAPVIAGSAPGCGANYFGTLPYRELGLGRDIAEDGWGNMFSYTIYTDTAPTCFGTGRDWGHDKCFGTAKAGGFSLREDTAPPGSPNVAAVIISHGSNGLGAWVAALGTRNTPAATCQELRNTGDTTECITGDINSFYKGERPGLDDVVATLSSDEIVRALAKQGGDIKLPAAQASSDLESLRYKVIDLKRGAGCGSFSLPDSYDPWGNKYSMSPPLGVPLPITLQSNGPPVISRVISAAEFTALTGMICP